MAEIKGTIAGKNIVVYSPKCGNRYSDSDISNYLRKFSLYKALRLIGELSHQLIKSRKEIYYIHGIPVTNGILAYLTMLLIENSNDYRSKDMSVDDLLVAIDMFFGLSDPFEEDPENSKGFLVRLGLSQFDYDREVRNLLPRTLILYDRLWNSSASKCKADVSAAIQEISGLKLSEILVLGLTFSGFANKGFFHLHEGINEKREFFQDCFSIEKQKIFFNWISCTYDEFRSLSRSEAPPKASYDKYRFNPLFLKPAITPDRNVKPGFPQVYLTPIPSLIYEKVTRNLYFSLAKHFADPKGNLFRSSFGFVFEEYVGLLLKQFFGEHNVKPEWRYGSKRYPKDTLDWFVVYNGSAILVEVKQSGLYLDAKKWGRAEDVQKSLMRSIGSGVNQMWEFECDVSNDSSITPEEIEEIKIAERLVVTYDRSYFLNSILRDEIKKIYPSISDSYHWHAIAIEELEYFLGIVGKELIVSLTEKRLDANFNDMEFKDYFSRKYPGRIWVNPYLDTIYSDFLGELGFSDKEIREKIF
ncbi:hypothetical protein PGN35_006635 [Nodosilinea sp. PGN35]|uniref:hypothetical protein n=1 Tax=Nodosilinea sp. PGN35 TaxID=3020489 RepID=UPI0023B2603C|nr:hypothetical protein [Nodosilinea sp. TSF1-S3]MDF0366023.1 hypothetical protein [Nodosilinea sp. TSF1-S3]